MTTSHYNAKSIYVVSTLLTEEKHPDHIGWYIDAFIPPLRLNEIFAHIRIQCICYHNAAAAVDDSKDVYDSLYRSSLTLTPSISLLH